MTRPAPARAAAALSTRLEALSWPQMAEQLDRVGFATTGPLLDAAQCRSLVTAYPDDELFRKTIIMQRHGYGSGAYKYFRYPLPEIVQALRTALYPPLAAVANRWQEMLRTPQRYPDTLEAWLARCHRGGQTRPTPLLLTYGTDDYNCLHRDLYGELVFPLQATILLSDPDADFTGGEFVLVEQRPRQQSAAEVVPLRQGEAVIFAVNERPARGARGVHRRALRHGVSRIRSGERRTLGIIFHDAA